MVAGVSWLEQSLFPGTIQLIPSLQNENVYAVLFVYQTELAMHPGMAERSPSGGRKTWSSQ